MTQQHSPEDIGFMQLALRQAHIAADARIDNREELLAAIPVQVAPGQVITDSPDTEQKLAESKVGAPGAPLSNSNGGGGTTMDDNLKKISDNVNRSVEQKQVNPTPTS